MVICKYDTIESKVLMHSWIWYPQGNLGTISSWTARDTMIIASLDPSPTVVTNTQADPVNNVTFVPDKTDLLVPVPHRTILLRRLWWWDVKLWPSHSSPVSVVLMPPLCWVEGSSLSKNEDLSSACQKEADEGKKILLPVLYLRLILKF